jgi:urease accessory protein
MPLDTAVLSYAAGFMLATALLHCAGIAIGLAAGRLSERRRIMQATGGAMALAGVVLLVAAG